MTRGKLCDYTGAQLKMEENQTSQVQEETQSQEVSNQSQNNVSFPKVESSQKSGGGKTILIIGILILVGILGFVIYKSATSKVSESASSQPTPYDNFAASDDGAMEEATPEATPVAIDRSKVSIQVLNGTGISGEAAYLQTQLSNLGYTDIKAANATSQDQKATEVTFSSSLDQGIISEITQKLKSLYQEVTTSNSGSTTYDVVVITGLRKGATAKPSSTPAPTSTPTPTPTASSTN